MLTMNILRTTLPSVSNRFTSILIAAKSAIFTSVTVRPVTILAAGRNTTKDAKCLTPCALVSKVIPPFTQQARSYKVKSQLRRRCEGCYFEKRFGRLYVECTLKPRHKQMQKVHKKSVYKDDYSEGPWLRAAHWKYRTDRFYRMGQNKYSHYNWLEGRLGVEI